MKWIKNSKNAVNLESVCIPSVFIFREVRTSAKSVALNITIPSLLSGIFIVTSRWKSTALIAILICILYNHAIQSLSNGEHEPITGAWEESPPRGPGAEPWSGRGGQGRNPSEAESILSFSSANDAKICPFLLSSKLLEYAFRENVVALLSQTYLLHLP